MAKIGIAGIAFFLICAGSASASGDAQAPDAVRVQILDKQGNVETLSWPVRIRIAWKESRELPKIQLLVQAPDATILSPESGKAAQFPSAIKDPGNPTGQTYLAEEQDGAFAYPVMYRRSKGAAPVRALLILLATGDRKATLMHPSCEEAGVNLLPREPLSSLKFVAIRCQVRTDDSVSLQFGQSRTLRLTTSTPAMSIEGRVATLEVPSPEGGWKTEQSIARVSVVDSDDNRSVSYTISYRPVARKRPPLAFSAGLGVSEYSYHQGGLLGQDLSETVLTGKVAATWRLVPDVIDFNVNGFASLVPLTHSPESLGTVRIYGANGRVGYHLPTRFLNLDYTVHTGWYFWSMSVNDSKRRYGISSASGPQLYFIAANHAPKSHGWWLYTKLALMSERAFKFASIDSNEIAVGGGYDLTRSPNPWSLYVDLAQTRFTGPNDWMKLISVTAGIQRTF